MQSYVFDAELTKIKSGLEAAESLSRNEIRLNVGSMQNNALGAEKFKQNSPSFR